MYLCMYHRETVFNILKVTSAVYYIMAYSIFNLVIPVKQRHAKHVMSPNLNVNLLLLLGVQLTVKLIFM